MEKENKLAKLLNDELTEEELALLKADPDYALYEKIKRYSSSLEIPDETEDSLLLKGITGSEKNKKTHPLYPKKWLQIAASILLLLTVGLFYLLSGDTAFDTTTSSQVHFSLPDASEVTLNTGSRIAYNSHSWFFRRRLRLDGEAYFRVAHGKVFTVSTASGAVRVLGTRFNVQTKGDDMEVSCYEGKVEVTHQGKKKVLTAGQALRIQATRWVQQPTAVTLPAWTENRLNFRSATLKEILEELERTYSIKIEVKQHPKTDEFTGTMPSDDIGVAMDIVDKVFSMEHVKTADRQYQLIPL